MYSVRTKKSRTKKSYAPLLALSVLIVSYFGPAVESAEAQSCSGQALFDETLNSGSRWEFCWANNSARGLVISDVFYTPPGASKRRVAKELSLAQIHVVSNDNATRISHASSGGLGGSNLRTMSAADCPGGQMRSAGGRTLLCRQIADIGYGYKYYTELSRAYALTVYTVSSLSTGNYVTQFRFHDNGSVEASIGSTGVLPTTDSSDPFGWTIDSVGTVAAGYVNVYDWRLDLDVGSTGADDFVEEIQAIPSSGRDRKMKSINRLTTEQGRNVNNDTKRFWRIRDSSTFNSDGRAASYELEPLNHAHRYVGIDSEPWSRSDFYVTRYQDCERLTVGNPTNNCASNVAGFINSESTNGADVVLWYRHSFYRLPRTEDWRSVKMHWDGFIIVPRDHSATNPLADVNSSKPASNMGIDAGGWS